MQLAPAEKAEGKPPCFYWRSVPISDCAISRFQPNLPPMTEGSLPPIPNAEYATAIWAMEGYLQVYLMKKHQLLVHCCLAIWGLSLLALTEPKQCETKGVKDPFAEPLQFSLYESLKAVVGVLHVGVNRFRGAVSEYADSFIDSCRLHSCGELICQFANRCCCTDITPCRC